MRFFESFEAATAPCPSLHWSADLGCRAAPEVVAVEAPLAIEIAYQRNGCGVARTLAVTMRTPGHDVELAHGFLLAEGIIRSLADVNASELHSSSTRGEPVAAVRVALNRAPTEDLQRVSRGLLTSSACGLCGRPSLENLPLLPVESRGPDARFRCEVLAGLPDILQSAQPGFGATGGSHAAGLFDANGRLRLVREDVGRHNAVDKLVGAALREGADLSASILVLSGRASFELVQKAAVAGVPILVAVGAPSSLAVALAQRAGITLIGFARGDRCNVYTHATRLALSQSGSPAVAEERVALTT